MTDFRFNPRMIPPSDLSGEDIKSAVLGLAEDLLKFLRGTVKNAPQNLSKGKLIDIFTRISKHDPGQQIDIRIKMIRANNLSDNDLSLFLRQIDDEMPHLKASFSDSQLCEVFRLAAAVIKKGQEYPSDNFFKGLF